MRIYSPTTSNQNETNSSRKSVIQANIDICPDSNLSTPELDSTNSAHELTTPITQQTVELDANSNDFPTDIFTLGLTNDNIVASKVSVIQHSLSQGMAVAVPIEPTIQPPSEIIASKILNDLNTTQADSVNHTTKDRSVDFLDYLLRECDPLIDQSANSDNIMSLTDDLKFPDLMDLDFNFDYFDT